MVIASRPDVSHGVIQSGFEGRWPLGSFRLHGCGAETQLRSRCYLWFDRNSVSVCGKELEGVEVLPRSYGFRKCVSDRGTEGQLYTTNIQNLDSSMPL